jgi:dTDP-4-amino-4,6-dideoxygalactose transaminase
MRPVIEIARRHKLLVIEDLAQGWRGPDDRGHPESDAAMFSFGPIKTATALGGAVLQLREPAILQTMRETQADWPLQSRSAYCRRTLKYAAIKLLSSRISYSAIVAVARLLRCDYDAAFARLVRGFSGPELLTRLRQRPCPALVSLLSRRASDYDQRRLKQRAALAERLLDQVEGVYELPGRAARDHSHWVLPVMSDHPPSLLRCLADSGFHATQGRSLSVVEPPPGREALEPHVARGLLAKAVFLPLYPELPSREIDRLARVLLAQADRAPIAALQQQPRAAQRIARPTALPNVGERNLRVPAALPAGQRHGKPF